MINKIAKGMSEDLVKIRRFLHTIPETDFDTFETSQFIQKKLNEMEIEYKILSKTGVVGIIEGKKGNGETVLIRADMDALPITELNDVEYKSTHEGKMHACGHDAHVTCLLGACKILKTLENEFCGNVKVMFQPAEETTGGAEPMIKEGLLKDPDVQSAIALHVEPLCSVGTLQYRDEAIMASPDDFKIIIRGKGGHGACPQDCINPITAGSEFISEATTIVKDNFADPSKCVVSFCTVNAGTLNNIIPDYVEITGTARSLDNETRARIEILLEDYVKRVCEKFKCSYEYTFNKLYPPLLNSHKINQYVLEAAKEIDGFDNFVELEKSSMTGDDFSYIAQLVPSSYFKLGVGNEKFNKPLHSSTFNLDERALPLGAAVLANTAMKILNDNFKNKR